MIDYSIQKIESPEVYLSNQSSLSIGASDMHNLVNLAKELPRNRIRYCAHASPSDVVHEMFIVHPKDAYVRPHKHINKSESIFILLGNANYIEFYEDGKNPDGKKGDCRYLSPADVQRLIADLDSLKYRI